MTYKMSPKDFTAICLCALVSMLFAIAVLVSGCGKDSINDPVLGCVPQPVADGGGDQTLELGNTDVAQLGSEKIDGMKYDWSGPEGLSDYHVAQPYFIATKAGKFLFSLKVTSEKCGSVAKSDVMIEVLEEPKMSADSMTVKIKDRFGVEKTYHTGYIPSRIPRHTLFVHMPKDGYFSSGPLPLVDVDLTPPSFIVNSQVAGSCWAEGASSAGTANLFKFFNKTNRVSAQRIIDCSGFGTASGGGQISIDDFVMPLGFVYIDDYPYDGRDHRCSKEKSVFREQAERTFELSNASGGPASPEDHINAMLSFGAPEVCGASSALRNGGWVTSPGGGGTDHCYARMLALRGELHGFPAGWYKGEQNSWGKGWGGGVALHPGQGAYRWTDENGKEVRSNVETEHKYMVMHNPCPPPILAGMKDKTIRQIKGTPQFVRIGVAPVTGQIYLWDHASLLKEAPMAHQSMAYAQPLHTTVFTLTTKNSCAEAHASLTVHVVEAMGDALFEITETGPKKLPNAEYTSDF